MYVRPLDRRGYSDTDVSDAIADAVVVSCGLKKLDQAHPLTADAGSRALLDLAASFNDRDGRVITERSAALANVSGHFADAIAAGAQLVAAPVLSKSLADVRMVCKEVQTRDLKPSPLPVLTSQMVDSRREGKQYETLIVGSSSDSVEAIHTTRIIGITEQVLLGEDMSLISGALATAVDGVGRTIQKATVTALEANPTLSDGRELFSATDGNNATPGGLDVAALNAASDALRNIPDKDGNPLNCEPAVLLVPSDVEATAHALVASLSNSGDRLQVVASPWLASGAAYLLADPQTAPTLALATWAGMNGEITSFTPATAPDLRTWSMDGIALRFNSCWGINVIGRGAVKFTTA